MDRRLIELVVLTTFVIIQYNNVVARSTLKIVNGTAADEGEFPYMVQLRVLGGFFLCGGGIIGSKWVLTAGHCVAEDVDSIVYGTNKLYDYGDGTPNTSINVKRTYQHPNFQYIPPGIPIYDLGLLELEEEIPFSDIAQPVQLVEANATIPVHVQGVLSGWGVNTTWGDVEPYLQKINLQLLSDEECQKKINDYSGEESFIPIHNICSDDYHNGECYGDSGSPYVMNGTQYGTVSWSFKPCGVVPGTYSRISNPDYRNWIKNVTGI